MANGVFKKILAAAVTAGLAAFINFVENDKKKNVPTMGIDDDGLDYPLECPRCGDTMRYMGEGTWICPGCDNTAEREDGEEDIYFYYNEPDDYDEYYDDIPEGCKACGGDYPNCCSSCNLMSD